MVAVGIILGYKMNDKAEMSFITALNGDHAYPVGRVEEVLRYIDAKYVNDINTDSLSSIGINSIVSALDPHSIYLTPQEMIEVNETMQGNFKGIGIESLYINDTVNIVRVLDNAPAAESGIQAFDQIIKIDGKDVAGNALAFKEIRDLLRGTADKTEVHLTLKRINEAELITLTVPLQQIKINSSEVSTMINDDTGIIKISQFTETTYQDFMEALERLHDTLGMKNLIIDVRDNPGGLLPQVTKVINQLIIEKERVIVYTQGDHSNKTEYKTTGKVFFPLDNLAILINENSASASEILAGVVQDWDEGVVIGRRSFGKGLVQEQYDLSNGGALRLTVAKYYTPAGRSIQKDYDSKDDYRGEIADRYSNGFMSKKDTTHKSEMVKTLKYGRPIYSNYGISPDIYIPTIDSDLSEKEITALTYTYEYAYKMASRLKSKSATKVEILEGFKRYLVNQDQTRFNDLAFESEKFLDIIYDDIQIDLERITSGPTASTIASYHKDKAVAEAVAFFNSGKTLKEISTIK